LALALIFFITITHTSLFLALCVFHFAPMIIKKSTAFFKKATNVVHSSQDEIECVSVFYGINEVLFYH